MYLVRVQYWLVVRVESHQCLLLDALAGTRYSRYILSFIIVTSATEFRFDKIIKKVTILKMYYEFYVPYQDGKGIIFS